MANNPDTKGADAKKGGVVNVPVTKKRMKDSPLSPFPEKVLRQEHICHTQYRVVYRREATPSGGPSTGCPSVRNSFFCQGSLSSFVCTGFTLSGYYPGPRRRSPEKYGFLQVNGQGNLTKDDRFGGKTFRCLPAGVSKHYQNPGHSLSTSGNAPIRRNIHVP